MSIKKTVLLLLFAGCAVVPVRAADEAAAAAVASADAGPSAFDQFLDSVGVTESALQGKVNSTKLFGGSSPVSFSGEGRVKIQFHNLNTDLDWVEYDRSYVASGWEGNESMVRLGMVVRPGRNTVLWSKIGFQNTLPGYRWRPPATADGNTAQFAHDKSMVSANIHEDMNAGIAIRTVPASFWLRMGNVNWVEASPFTIWKAQPRTFAWEFLPYEIEQPIARYYEYNIANGEKAGRAAWHKKPFNGISFESISLPAKLALNVLWARYERYDNFEQEYVDFSNDVAYTGEDFPVKGTGIGDNFRHIFHARLAANKLFGELTPGISFNRFDYNDDVVFAIDDNGYLFLKAQGVYIKELANRPGPLPLLNGKAFFKEPQILSFDIRGPIANRLFDLHTDISIAKVDTTYLKWDSTSTKKNNAYTKETKSTPFIPAFYTRLNYNGVLPFQLDVVAIGKGFYSPLSFAVPQDAFYAFNSNMVGSGKFIGRGEASPYVQNTAGALLSFRPKIAGYGHLRFAYGQHAQLQPGRDLLYLPYRLNGLDYFSFWHSSYLRWGSGPLLGPQPVQKGKRIGNESFLSSAYDNPVGMEGGGLYTDYLSTFECFVPWTDSSAARKNRASQEQNVSYRRVVNGDTSETAFIPVHRKFSNNVEVDIAYDVSGLVGYPNDFFLGGFAAVNNVATAFTPLAINDKNDKVQLWSVYLRFEPAIALTKKFYLLGILGFENWRSQKAMMDFTPPEGGSLVDYRDLVRKYLGSRDSAAFSGGARYFRVPIDYRDAAVGLGFDWEILSRVGLHGRFKYMWHKDVNFTYNNWGTPIASLEIKTWF